jgi:ABC-type sulfate transport system permease component
MERRGPLGPRGDLLRGLSLKITALLLGIVVGLAFIAIGVRLRLARGATPAPKEP